LSLIIASLLLWGYAVIPELQQRFWSLFLVPMVFVIGNSRTNPLKLSAILLISGVYLIKYTVIHDLLIDQRTLYYSTKSGGFIAFESEGIRVDDLTRNFNYGSRIQLRAIPKAGFRFDRWVGDCNSQDEICILDMSYDRKVETRFIPLEKMD
jgi:hypothetical protein